MFSPPYTYCVAISQTDDATDAYCRYAFTYGSTDFIDYPKLGVWPDAYYTTYNIFANGSTFIGAMLCALDRNSMLTGAAATQQCLQLSNSFGGVLPSDVDGTTPPPVGATNYLVNFGANSLNEWQFHVDLSFPTNTKLTGPINIPVKAFTPTCGGDGGACVPQQGTTTRLDALGDRLMYRFAYRNFGDHESLLVDHTVVAGKGRTGFEFARSDDASSAHAIAAALAAHRDPLSLR